MDAAAVTDTADRGSRQRVERGVVATPPAREHVRADLEQVRATHPRVAGVDARVLGDRTAAEDVVQEGFLAFGRSVVPSARACRGC